MQVYTYYTKETVFPSTKLNVKNVHDVFGTDSFTIKIKPAIVGYDKQEQSFYIYTNGDVVIHDVDRHIHKANKRLFKLLRPFAIFIENPSALGCCEYLHFHKEPTGSYICYLVRPRDDDVE